MVLLCRRVYMCSEICYISMYLLALEVCLPYIYFRGPLLFGRRHRPRAKPKRWGADLIHSATSFIPTPHLSRVPFHPEERSFVLFLRATRSHRPHAQAAELEARGGF